MTSATVDLQKKYTHEERDAMFEAYAEACGRADHEGAARILEQMPINARWAKIIADVMGKDFLLEFFNITVANEEYGEGWLDGE